MKKEKIIFPEFEEEPEYYENVGLLGIIVITIGILVLLVLIVKTLSQLCSRFVNNQNNENKNTNDMGDICLNLTRIYNDTRYGYLSDENAFSKMKQVKLKHPLHTLETMVLSKQQN